jgi:hypothetical protein
MNQALYAHMNNKRKKKTLISAASHSREGTSSYNGRQPQWQPTTNLTAGYVVNFTIQSSEHALKCDVFPFPSN